MKRSTTMTILMLLLIGVSIISPLVAGAELVSHEVSTNHSNYEHGDDHNVFYAQGIYWAFSWKYFYTSADMGVTWSAGTDISDGNATFGTNQKSLAVCTDTAGAYVYVVSDCYWTPANYANRAAFRRGELHGNGTITWTAWAEIPDWVVNGDDYGVNANIAVDGTGHYWVGHTKYIAYTTNTSYGYVIGSSTTDGTWATDAAKTLICYQVGGYIGGTVMPVGLSSTAVVLYSSNNGYIYGRTWQTGSQTWSAAVHSAGTCRSYLDPGITEGQAYFSGVAAYIDQVAIVYNRSSDNYLIHTWYDSDFNLFPNSNLEHQVQTATSTSTWPCISISSLSDDLYVWWIGTPLANHLYYKMRDANLAWQSVVDLGEESAGFFNTSYISAIDRIGEDALSVIYRSGNQHLRFDRLYGNETGSLPYGIAIDPSDVTATSATLNGLCTWSGGSGANATFVFQDSTMYVPIEIDIGTVGSNEYFDAAISDLVPSTLHWFYVKFENGGGNYSSNTKFFYTLENVGLSAPTVGTLPADYVTSTGAWMEGTLLYDGGLPCYGGFDLRVQGTSTWIRSWYAFTNVWPFNTDRPLRSPVSFTVEVSNLSIDTIYEYRALAKNSLTEPAVVYGATVIFTTGHVTVPTPTPGGIQLPPGLTFPFTISSTLKTILGILITVIGMILIVAFIRSNGGMLAAAAYGLGMTILFVVIGWYPLWIILLIGAIVGLLAFLLILGGRK